MSSAYTPGLEVSAFTTIRKTRELPLPGKTLVEVGDRVSPKDQVLSAELPGEVFIARIADAMGVEPVDAVSGMKVQDGDIVSKGQLLCETKTFFGLFTSEFKSPVDGHVEFFTEGNAHLGIRLEPIPLTVNSYLSGRVVDLENEKSVTIETDGAFIQGIFGVGGERFGKIFALPVANTALVQISDLETHREEIKGGIVIGGASFSKEALDFAEQCGVSAVVTGSIDATTLAHFLNFEIGVSITGDEDVPFTLIITEGFGQLPLSPRISKLAESLLGKEASVNGATQVRAGAMRPEIIVPLDPGDTKKELQEKNTVLQVGAKIRLIRVPHFGQFGEVIALPSKPTKIASGAKVRVLEAKLESGDIVTVPRANVELI